MLTLQKAIEHYGVEVDEHLDREMSIPVLTGPQRQGDVLILPTRSRQAFVVSAVTPEGVPVVRGEVGGNTHMLLAAGTVSYDEPITWEGSTLIGRIAVADEAVAYLAHPEHGYLGIGPGAYAVRRQREQTDEIRLVQD